MDRVPREFKPGNEADLVGSSLRALICMGQNKSELRRTTRRPMSIGGLLEATEKRNNEESRTKDFEGKRRKKGVKGSVPQQRK